jgi:hypothetical protein
MVDGHMPHIDTSRRGVTHSKSQSSADASNLSYPRFHGVRHLFNRMRPSADIVRKQRRRLARRTPEVVDVPLAPVTYVCFLPDSFEFETHCIHLQRDYVAGEEDGVRPYSLFFCLGWFQKHEETLDPSRQLYDDELAEEEEEDRLDVPIPTTRYDSSLIVRRITNALL